MSISDLFDSGFRNRNKGHFSSIVRVALSDGIIGPEEKQFLDKLAIKLEISQAEYEEILENRQIDYNNSREQIELRLSGLVLEDEGQLRLYNPIYKEIFNLNWVEQEKEKLRLYIEEFEN